MVDASTVPVEITVTGSAVEVETSDLNLAGTYQLIIQRDVTDGTLTTTKDQLTFDVHLIISCSDTVINAPVVPDLTTTVLAVPPLPPHQVALFTDQVSLTNGDLSGVTYCGNRVYSLDTSTPSFGTFDPSTLEISVATSDPVDIGTHAVTLILSLVDYPAVSTPVSFNVIID